MLWRRLACFVRGYTSTSKWMGKFYAIFCKLGSLDYYDNIYAVLHLKLLSGR
jgi:hypothetical protein